MLTSEELRAMCMPPAEGKAFFRPLICKGDLANIDIFFVGINPATPIYPGKDMNLDNYVELLCNYDKFINYYKQVRINNGKSEFSRTRTGMNSFLTWLSEQSECAIAETNVIGYPTANVKLLRKEPDYILESGKEIFRKLLMSFTPRLLILHGKETVQHCFDLMVKQRLVSPCEFDIEKPIKQLESQMPLFEFRYPRGENGTALACRHFRYYGAEGESFTYFCHNVSALLTK